MRLKKLVFAVSIMFLIPGTAFASKIYLIFFGIPKAVLFLCLVVLLPITLFIRSRYKGDYFLDYKLRMRWRWILGLPLVIGIVGIGLTFITTFFIDGDFDDIAMPVFLNWVFSVLVLGLLIMDFRLIKIACFKQVSDALKRHNFSKGDFCVEGVTIRKGNDVKTRVCISRNNGKFEMTLVEDQSGNERRYTSEANTLDNVVAFFERDVDIRANVFKSIQ